MRKVIKGRLYDTDTAAHVAEWQEGYCGDLAYCHETLYRKRTGEYFVHGEGGAMSRYSERCGQSEWQGGEGIRPLTYKEARVWLERHGSAEEFESEFGVPEDGMVHDLHVTISEVAWQALSRRAAMEGTTVGAIISVMAEGLC